MLRDLKKQDDGLDKSARRRKIAALRETLVRQQQLIREAKLPVIVLVEGWASAGKGSLINQLIREMDPRFFTVVSPAPVAESQERYPFLHKFFRAIPENGKFLFMDSGWMEDTVHKYLRREITNREYRRRVESCRVFERQLRDNGYVVIKLFLHISRQEQLERISRLRSDPDTEWRVTGEDLWQHCQYDRFLRAYDEFMEDTGEYFPWHAVDSTRRKRTLHAALEAVVAGVDAALKAGRYRGCGEKCRFPLAPPPHLWEADLTAFLPREEYKRQLDRLQSRLRDLHNRIYRKKIPVIICYEGWDAAGKGGNIRRLAYPLDPRGFDVIPIASPAPQELARHYLWRFWTQLPRTGHVAIFDRSWYGRVMVERIEGLCAPEDWQRAYGEINEFEKELTDWGAVILKFWIHIDPDTQLQRFQDRQNTPEKQWKITQEDWRNREKWPQYEQAVEEMLQKTSTEYAPWHIIPSVDKKYARIRTLQIVTDELERAVERYIVRGIKSGGKQGEETEKE